MKTHNDSPSGRPPRLVRRMLDSILDRYPHFDVIELYLSSSEPGLPMEHLQALCGGGALGMHESPQYQPAWQYHLILQQPSREALALLLASLGGHRVLITKVEVTLDLRVKSKQIARKLQWALVKMMVVKSWRQEVLCFKKTVYFGRRTVAVEDAPKGDAVAVKCTTRKSKHRAAARVYVIYVRRAKPGSPWPGKRCLRLEARFRGKAAIEAIGITTVQCLLDFDHAQFWAERVRLLVPLSLAAAGTRFGSGQSEVSRTMLTRRGRAWQDKFLVEGHFCLQNAALAHRELWGTLDARWTGPILLGRAFGRNKTTL